MLEPYLIDEDFGEMAAGVLSALWFETNEPPEKKRLSSGVDFSRTGARRAARASNPADSCPEADKIFAAIETLLAPDPTEKRVPAAVALGIIGARLPHGERQETIETLLRLAPRDARASLLLSLVLSGEEIDIKWVSAGVDETLEAAKTEKWILSESDAYRLRIWLRLLPYAASISELPAIVGSIPESRRTPDMLDDVVRGLGDTPSVGAEDVLFTLAECDPRFYSDYHWRSAALQLETLSSTRCLIDLAVSGMLKDKQSSDVR